ncbi:MAG: phosphoribosylformylglycinamidine synthase subunit PurL [Planctomycetes bacterium]|nr:phosphoribosylformylglycinamidine synthase subunit PurL [Planctomycetota bacterium]
MDPVEESSLKALRDLGINARAVRAGRKILFAGTAAASLEKWARKSLANEIIDDVQFRDVQVREIPPGKPAPFRRLEIPLRKADAKELERISRDGQLSLTLREMEAVQAHFRNEKRDPTDAELETVAQTWSEHCKHKTLTGVIEMGGERIENLLKSTIAKATEAVAAPWCLSVFKDNAGVIAFDEKWALTFKVETHNHPSALEPYGGAGTGIGGVLRDTMGCGLGAKPIASTDVFCVASPDAKVEDLPPGVIHPKKVLQGVVSGVRDYGNRMGVPTVNGAVLFDERYLGNPLVFAGNIGLIPRGAIEKEARPGDAIVVAGGRTGRDGIHGATFSSLELTHESEAISSGAVQIGNAITEKRLLDVMLEARDQGLYRAVTDCGAGGLSSAVGEMGEACGADVNLDRVPLKYEGLTYTEIWISEAQERMVFAVPPERLAALLALFASEDVEATEIGSFTDTGRLRLRHRGQLVADLDLEFLHKGVPVWTRQAEWNAPAAVEKERPSKDDFSDDLAALLRHPNIASKEWIVRLYDHEVQGRLVIKPFQGPAAGPGDAAVIRPVFGSNRGAAIGCGMNPWYGDLDPYVMALAVVDEALRNVVAVGGDPAQTAILDNFAWGNCAKPDRLGSLVRAAQGCRDAAIAYRAPFISGKDSLNNEFTHGGRTIAIPPSLLISALSIVPDVTQCVTLDLKAEGNPLWLLGWSADEMGGSHYLKLRGETGARPPRPDLERAPKLLAALHAAIRAGLVRSCHDLSEGGLAVAAAEMAIAGGLGCALILDSVPAPEGLPWDAALFSESCTRFLVEVDRAREGDFARAFLAHPAARVGEVTSSPIVRFFRLSRGSYALGAGRGKGAAKVDTRGTGKLVCSIAVEAARRMWKGTLDW